MCVYQILYGGYATSRKYTVFEIALNSNDNMQD